ncbi:hypothetical protein [Halorussus litoreus]|uniref:hypothetical protein n=1 Tax=Halorussus litoreus TaxID=1710536 RepID=UPI000E2577AE|nr:hypothetical protein [Halorussus litoreus]
MADDRTTDTDVDRTDPTTNVTTGGDTIREWIEESGARPGYRTSDAGEREPYVYHPDAGDEDVEEADWDEFHDDFEEHELALIRHTDRTGSDEFELVERTEAIERATLDDEEVERALLEGDTVETQITETRVVEKTVQETETFQSEVVESEIVSDDVVDTELVRREVTGVHFGEMEAEDRVAIIEDSETTGWDEEVEEIDVTEHEYITVDVDETREVTRELVERRTVETRVVDRDVEETETVESETLESRVDLEGVQRTILESDILGGQIPTEEVIEGGHVESEFSDDDTILTELYERRIVRDEVVDRKRLTFELVDEETVSSETIESVLVESMLVGSDAMGEDTEIEGIAIDRADTEVTDAGMATGHDTMTDEGVTASDDTMTATETTGTSSEATMGDVESTDDTMADEAMTDDTMAASDETIVEGEEIQLDDHDVGKDVIDANDEQVGVVTEVDEDDNVLYVDPHPGLAQRVKTRLGWEGHSEDAYSVTPDRIEMVGDDEIRLRSL